MTDRVVFVIADAREGDAAATKPSNGKAVLARPANEYKVTIHDGKSTWRAKQFKAARGEKSAAKPQYIYKLKLRGRDMNKDEKLQFKKILKDALINFDTSKFSYELHARMNNSLAKIGVTLFRLPPRH